MAKWQLNRSQNPRVRGFLHEDICLGFIDELAAKWDGRIGCDWSTDPGVATVAGDIVAKKRFRYTRVGHDSRELELLPAGKIGEGRADCEEAWSVEEDDRGEMCLMIV